MKKWIRVRKFKQLRGEQLRAVFLAGGLVFAAFARSAAAGEVVLEDSQLQVAFDSDSGALIHLESKSPHWVLERRPELGASFRLFAPLPHRRYNPVFGPKQHATEVKKVSDHEVDLQWKDLISENGGVLPMTLAAKVTLTHGVLTFSATLDNDSSLPVETIDYPYFGDFNPPTPDLSMAVRMPANGKIESLQTNADELYPHFRNEKGYWGVSYPTKMLEAQPGFFCLIQSPGEGLYCEVNPPAATPYRLQYTFEQHPGLLSGATSVVPATDEISGLPVHLEFRFCHFIFAPAHSTTTLAPIVLACYPGDWQAGAALYQERHPVTSR